MDKYFGTDGIRGVANEELTPELAFKVGRAAGYVLTRDQEQSQILIGRDTRISGQTIESALTAGLLSIGAEVMRVGIISTPGGAYVTEANSGAAGIMISPSHTPGAGTDMKIVGSDVLRV